jgi:biotin carboxylase
VFGTKHTARDAARAAGVPIFPGSDLLADLDDAVAAAEAIGYPVMLKATGGGGGIGMQVCRTADDLRAAYLRVVAQAERSFGSAGVFVERYVENARHVEVQIFGDGAGRVLSLGDRDCSLQRRHQKVLEEAPAPALPDSVREQLHASSRALAAAVGYRSAGTVEFVYDAARQEASFLEVNARLQVEHPSPRRSPASTGRLDAAAGHRGQHDVRPAPRRIRRDQRARGRGPDSTPRTPAATTGPASARSPRSASPTTSGWTAGSRTARGDRLL